jgi:hypothetical protein
MTAITLSNWYRGDPSFRVNGPSVTLTIHTAPVKNAWSLTSILHGIQLRRMTPAFFTLTIAKRSSEKLSEVYE